MAPVSIKAPTITKRAKINKIISHSILDKILFEYIENRQGPDEIEAQGFDEALITRVLRMVNRNEFKRHQTPPILRVSPKAFGSGRRLPIVGKYLES